MSMPVRLLIGATLATFAEAAAAHTGHATASLVDGLVHPFGLDHLLAMLAVGVWSVAALPVRQRLFGPLVFMTAMLAGALAGASGSAIPMMELGIAASVALFGAMLLAPRALPASVGLAIVAAAASLHGLAHGAELPGGTSFSSYSAGFLMVTALLHAAGLGLGSLMLRLQSWVWRLVSAGLGAAGLLLITRL